LKFQCLACIVLWLRYRSDTNSIDGSLFSKLNVLPDLIMAIDFGMWNLVSSLVSVVQFRANIQPRPTERRLQQPENVSWAFILVSSYTAQIKLATWC